MPKQYFCRRQAPAEYPGPWRATWAKSVMIYAKYETEHFSRTRGYIFDGPGLREAARCTCTACFRHLQLVEVWRAHREWVTKARPKFGPGVAARFVAAAEDDPAEAHRGRPLQSEILCPLTELIGDDAVMVQPATTAPAPPPVNEP